MAGGGFKVCCVLLALLSAVSLGAGIADIIYTVIGVCPNTTGVCPIGTLAAIFTWIGSGVWGSVFSFATAILGLRYVGNPCRGRQMFLTVCFMSAVIFTPAMIVLNALEAYHVMTATPGTTAATALYDLNTPSAGFIVKFILPVAAAGLGLIAFFFLAGLLIYTCATSPTVEECYGEYGPDDDDSDLAPGPKAVAVAPPRAGSMNGPSFGYYYPSRIYQLPARTPGVPANGGVRHYGGRYGVPSPYHVY